MSTINRGIITRPLSAAGLEPLSNLSSILSSFSCTLYVITGDHGLKIKKKDIDNLRIVEISHSVGKNRFAHIFNHILLQFKIVRKIIKLNSNVKTWVFFLDSHAFLLPVITAKLLSKEVVIVTAASIKNSAQAKKKSLSQILVQTETIGYKLANKIIIYSPNLIKDWNLEKYKNKINIASEHIIDFNFFSNKQKIEERNYIGYIGRLSHEKGILNLMEAIKILTKETPKENFKFLIGGDGNLREFVEDYISLNNLEEFVEYIGWIPHEKLPMYLNKLKLLVIPSYSEGLPNIMLESMACGTPILSSSVGAIPNIIKDQKNGFLMENNSPESIAKNIIKIINSKKIDNISKNAINSIKNEFEYKHVLNKWYEIFQDD